MRQNAQNKASNSYINLVILSILGLMVNVAGARLGMASGLPLYLDNIGSALTAALGGYIPGIIVGFVTNLINGMRDIKTTYYGSLTVLIAVCSAWFARKGWYRKPGKLPLIALTFALIGGGIGSPLTWELENHQFAVGASASLAKAIYAGGHFSPFIAQYIADFALDLADKAITVLIVAFLLKLIPESVKTRLYYTGWRQKPLSAKLHAVAEGRLSRGMSLRPKIILLVAMATVITGVSVTGISFMHFRNAAIEEQTRLAQGVVKVVMDSFDHDRVDEYLEQGEAAPGYLESKTIMKHLMDSSDNIEFCYVYRILEDGCHVVFDPDTDDVPGAKPGEIVAFDAAFSDKLPALLAGRRIDPVISDETYGWLLTIYEPVYDSNGACQCYAAVDINMNQIAANGRAFLVRVVSLFFGFFVIILAIAIWLAEYNVILPINSMALTTNRFAFNSAEALAESLDRIRELNIHTGDEIENLYDSIVKTTGDMVANIAKMQKQSDVISKLQNGLIMVLADMVESRDQCTGDHVRKTAAYTDIIMRELRKEGIYTDQLTDAFMKDVVNSAPLHDVGKIQVPDAILNKPGRLTDEEFELMKRHTTAGSEIIARAMSVVSEEDSGYLKEAMNLAHYHHEKWSGEGYPCGLKGEEIPLSARIMAVADVFDALVSRRSYKEGFPLEKALGIIREGIGTHFDPNVAGAFLRAEDEVVRVMNTYMGE